LHIVQQSSGAGVSADRLPGAIADAIRICEYESKTIETAMDEALNS
jgi:hypothetical protein